MSKRNSRDFCTNVLLSPKSESICSGSIKSSPSDDFLLESDESHHHNALKKVTSKFAEFENETIQKQRQEIQLLISELRSRDRELNEMVSGHQKQLTAWEKDRVRIATLEENCACYERELLARNEEICRLTAKLQATESEEINRQIAIQNMQDQLISVTEQQCLASQHLSEAQEVNRSLLSSVKDLKSTISEHEQRQSELFQLLSSKDRDLSEAASHVAEMNAKLKRCKLQLNESSQTASDSKRQILEWCNKYRELKREIDYVKKQNVKLEEFSSKQRSEILQFRKQLIAANSEITVSTEREQRKDELFQLSKSKQERTDAELAALRDLCDAQQRDISSLQSNLDTAKNLLSFRQTNFTCNRSGSNSSYSQILSPSRMTVSSSVCSSPIHPFLRPVDSAASGTEFKPVEKTFDSHSDHFVPSNGMFQDSDSPKEAGFKDFDAVKPLIGALEEEEEEEEEEGKSIECRERKSASDVPEMNMVKNPDMILVREASLNDVSSCQTVAIQKFKEEYPIDNQLETFQSGATSFGKANLLSQYEGHSSLAFGSYNSLIHQRTLDGLEKCSVTSSGGTMQDYIDDVNSDDDVSRDDMSVGAQNSVHADNFAENGTEVENEDQVHEEKLVKNGMKIEDGFVKKARPYEQNSLVSEFFAEGNELMERGMPVMMEKNLVLKIVAEGCTRKEITKDEDEIAEVIKRNDISHFESQPISNKLSLRKSSTSSVSQLSIQSAPALNYSSLGKTAEIKFSTSSYQPGHLLGSQEQLSEASGRDWIHCRNWNSTTGETSDKCCSYKISSSVRGVRNFGGHGDGSVDLRIANASVPVTEKDYLQQKYVHLVEDGEKQSAASSGNASKSSSNVDVLVDPLI